MLGVGVLTIMQSKVSREGAFHFFMLHHYGLIHWGQNPVQGSNFQDKFSSCRSQRVSSSRMDGRTKTWISREADAEGRKPVEKDERTGWQCHGKVRSPVAKAPCHIIASGPNATSTSTAGGRTRIQPELIYHHVLCWFFHFLWPSLEQQFLWSRFWRPPPPRTAST